MNPLAPAPPPGFLKLLDLSHYQTIPNFDILVADGVQGVICKALQGLTDYDDTFASKMMAAARVQILRGGYLFVQPGDDPVLMARKFVLALKPFTPCLAAFDLEELGAGSLVQWAIQAGVNLTFLDALLTEFLAFVATGVPHLYSTHYFFRTYLAGIDLSKYPLWVADYNKAATTPLLPPFFKTYSIWQRGERDQEPGLVDTFDYDVAPGPLQRLLDLQVTFKVDSDPVWARVKGLAGAPA